MKRAGFTSCSPCWLFWLSFLWLLTPWPLFAAWSINNTNKYAWSESVGWINFRPELGGARVSADHLAGFVWGENIGWIQLGAEGGGPYANTSTTNWGVNRDQGGALSNLSGYGWSETVGWIDFNAFGTSDNAKINPTTGSFSGYAWSPNVGWIHLSNGTQYKLAANSVNESPVIGGTPATTVYENSAYSFTPTASDLDADALTFSIQGKPVWATFNTATGTLAGTPGLDDQGNYSITIAVSDGTATATLPVFNLLVKDVFPPTITAIPNQRGNEDGSIGPIAFTIGDADTSLDTLTVTVTSSNGTMIPQDQLILAGTGANRTLTIKPSANKNGAAQITITVNDGTLLSSNTFNLDVAPTDDPTTIEGVPPVKATPGILYSFTPVVTNIDGDALSFSIVSKPSWATFNPATGVLSGIPKPQEHGNYNDIGIAVYDGTNTVTLPVFSVHVEDLSDPNIDKTPPLIAITDPVDGASLSGISWIGGSSSDAFGSGVASIKLQLTDGSGYLDNRSGIGLGLYPATLYSSDALPWVAIAEQDYANWIFLPPNIWKIDTTYSLTVRATDKAGNFSDYTILFAYSLDGGKAFTQLSMELSARAILQSNTLDISGQLTRMPATTMSMADRVITLKVQDPVGATVTTLETKTTDQDGHYFFPAVGGFSQKGKYTLEVNFAGTALLAASNPVASGVLVGQSAGYAVIVEGKISLGEGLASHNKTTNRIYQQLLDRGFDQDKIFYFNHDNTQPGVDALPTRAELEKIISGTHPTFQLASMMNGAPAPVYIIMVDHGRPNKFFLNGDTEIITPADLHGWLTTLESKLTAATLPNASRIVIIGSCYSGSFVPTLSAAGRVLISSAAAGEESYKGPQEDDGVRSGEFFLEALFKQLGRGQTFAKAFQEGVSQTSVYLRKGGGAANSAVPPFFDNTAQHPLLDDNGDKKGSNQLTTNQVDDGNVASGLFLGTGTSYVTNSLLNPAEVTAVTETLYLDAGQNTATLWARANDDSQVKSAWVEIRSPSTTLVAAGGSQQLEVDLPRFLLTPVNGQWTVDLSGKFSFADAGLYEIYYFMRDKESGDVSPMVRSLVYKKKAVNAAPAAFSLVSPDNDAQSKTVAVFKWAASTDADGVTYNLLIATDSAFQNVVYRQEELLATATFVDAAAKLADLASYYWKVQAVDAYGAVTNSRETWQFTTDNTNGIPAIVYGIVMSDKDFSRMPGAVLQINDTQVQIMADGSFILPTTAGSATVSGSQTGYQTNTWSSMDLEAGKATRVNIVLHELTSEQAVFTLDVDGNGQYNALTDGLLIVRHLNSMQNDALIAGIVDASGTRKTAAAIKAYLDSSRVLLDVDGSGGEPDPLTDGMLILRHLFGFRGEALIQGSVVGASATRKDANAISNSINSMMPLIH